MDAYDRGVPDAARLGEEEGGGEPDGEPDGLKGAFFPADEDVPVPPADAFVPDDTPTPLRPRWEMSRRSKKRLHPSQNGKKQKDCTHTHTWG